MGRDRSHIHPDIVFVSPEAKDDALTRRVIERLPDADIRYLSRDGDPLSELSPDETGLSSGQELSEVDRFTAGKRLLLLTRYKGSWLKACPGTSSHVCCNLWIVNPGEGCPLDCTYCYLQSYLKRNPTLKLYTNTAELLEAIGERASQNPDRLYRVGTGELIDSLVWDDLTDFTREIVPFIGSLPNVILELKSKDDCVDNLVDLRDTHNGNTVVSWSVNAREVSEKDEAATATLDERIAAAERVVAAGYRVGFHFDPLVFFDGWEEGYQEAVESIFSRIPSTAVAWVSVSSLRYQPDMQRIMMERFPDSSLPFGEQFQSKDSKLRYVQPIRFKMLRFVWEQLKSVREDMPVYMCMESSAAWRSINGGAPVAGSELAEVFTRRGRLPILPSSGPA